MAICTAGLVAFQDAVADGSIGARLTHLDRATAAQCASPKCRHHFAVVGGIGSWQRLLAFAPVSDMEACHDELICDGPSREAHATVWTRRRTDANGGSRITLWPRGAKRAKGGPKRAASREPVPRVGYDFTRYHLDVGARPCALYIDAAKLPDREGYVVVGTLACSGAAKPEDVVDVLAQVAVFPVGDKTQEVPRRAHPSCCFEFVLFARAQPGPQPCRDRFSRSFMAHSTEGAAAAAASDCRRTRTLLQDRRASAAPTQLCLWRPATRWRTISSWRAPT
jgi:hypothetical protein